MKDSGKSQIGIPFFQALGNHDMDYRLGGDETSDKTFKENYGPTYYSFNRGKVHYIVLDDVRYLGTERNYDGFVSQAQLDWMAKDLQYVAKDALVIISLHIPINSGVKNKAEFKEFLISSNIKDDLIDRIQLILENIKNSLHLMPVVIRPIISSLSEEIEKRSHQFSHAN